jgi:hypothetical protein
VIGGLGLEVKALEYFIVLVLHKLLR